jgi:hypothetical protein
MTTEPQFRVTSTVIVRDIKRCYDLWSSRGAK